MGIEGGSVRAKAIPPPPRVLRTSSVRAKAVLPSHLSTGQQT